MFVFLSLKALAYNKNVTRNFLNFQLTPKVTKKLGGVRQYHPRTITSILWVSGSVCGCLMYDNFFRIQQSTATGVVKDVALEGADDAEKTGRKHRRRGRARTRVRRRKPRKNSIFNRPASRGCSRDHARREKQAAVFLAGRSASQDRGRSPTRKSPPPSRARSAPRIQFKG